MDARRLHSFVCKRAPGRIARHHALNDLIAHSFASAGVPVTKEPVGLFRTDGKRPEGLTLIPGRAASHCAETSRSHTRWLYRISKAQPGRQVQQQKINGSVTQGGEIY